MTGVPTVALALPDPLVRVGLREVLHAGGLLLREEAADAEALLRAAAEPPHVCLVAAGSPAAAVIAVGRLSGAWPRTAVVLLASDPDAALLLRVVRAGGRGCLDAAMPATRLPAVLRGVLDGEPAAPRRLVGDVLERLRLEGAAVELAGTGGRRVILSPREAAVLRLLADGLSSHAVAAALDVSPVTVRRHVSRAAGKLGASDRGAALELFRAARAS
jgi:DNA-binding NarL/FixJ family response regulator